MQKHNVKVGSTYIVKVSGTLARVRITREHDRGGWYGINLATGREIRIRTAARLRSEAPKDGSRNLRAVVERAKKEIIAHVAAGIVPRTCASFSELHDYVDANGYGGAFERPFNNNETDFWNAVQDTVDRWIKQGGLKDAITEDEARRIVDEIEF